MKVLALFNSGLDSLTPAPLPRAGEGSFERFAMNRIEAYLGGAHKSVATKEVA
ncbi:MAG: hypothetical protein BroJett031_17720 [Betaproteobacteria bacterium]|jgi:hypothetical protein|nr:MAG: hypothetical protein BroJett031_17720 [Betaproteobacteria bacterium]